MSALEVDFRGHMGVEFKFLRPLMTYDVKVEYLWDV